MSKGVGGQAIKKFEDSKKLIYNYGSFDLNIPQYKTVVIDGVIAMKKECFQMKYGFVTNLEIGVFK